MLVLKQLSIAPKIVPCEWERSPEELKNGESFGNSVEKSYLRVIKSCFERKLKI
jgi:hypothetical protein